MSKTPENLYYTAEHEWLSLGDDGTASIGITFHAQEELGDIVFLELPSIGDAIKAGADFGVVESVKAVSDLIAPVDAIVTEINEALIDAPEEINSAPYDSWMLKVKLSDPSVVEKLLSATDYAKLIS